MKWKLALALLALLTLPGMVFAALGGKADTVQQDQAGLNATLHSTDLQKFTVHELQLPSGSLAREYAAPDGTVFAVAWEGPTHPNLRQLLGESFDPYVAAAKAQHAGRGPLSIMQPGLVVQSGGHMRAFRGRAYLPQLLPAGVTPDDIR